LVLFRLIYQPVSFWARVKYLVSYYGVQIISHATAVLQQQLPQSL